MTEKHPLHPLRDSVEQDTESTDIDECRELREEIEEEIRSIQKKVVGEVYENDYQHGFRDGCQHAIVCLRGVMGDDR